MVMRAATIVLVSAAAWALVPAMATAQATSAGRNAEPQPEPATSPVERDPLRRAYFGDLHVHTSWSTDARVGGNRVGPRGAYRFARGEAVELPNGITTRLDAPLDFVAITDHAEGFETIAACTDTAHPHYDSVGCRAVRNPRNTQAAFLRSAFRNAGKRPSPRNAQRCTVLATCLESERATWRRVQKVAEEFNDPGRFTTLVGYEFSSLLEDFGMLHRNVIFRGSDVIPRAISAQDVTGQADFFAQLDAACAAPCEVLTIPHNTNYSWGLTFSRSDEAGTPYSDEDLERRARIERLVEVTQQKGNSECQVGVGTTDEDCDFGIIFSPCEEGQKTSCAQPASFVRNALLEGLLLEEERRANPFALGMIGSTDTHNSDPGNTAARFQQARGNATAVRAALDRDHPVVREIRRTNVGGLAGVWAESNTREDIFDALRRREAFATSGSRLRVRFFAGDLPEDIESRSDALEVAYERGVPMGGDISGAESPRFWVWAGRDPSAPTLDRVQVVKGWIESGEQHHRVWDVVCSAGRRPGTDGRCETSPATVDTNTCERRDESGAEELQATFTDPTFEPDQRSFYYVRVLENPSCRWTTILANSARVQLPEDVKAAVQQRGWSSPIWLRP